MAAWVNVIYFISGLLSIVCLFTVVLFYFFMKEDLGQVFVIWLPVAVINLSLLFIKLTYKL